MDEISCAPCHDIHPCCMRLGPRGSNLSGRQAAIHWRYLSPRHAMAWHPSLRPVPAISAPACFAQRPKSPPQRSQVEPPVSARWMGLGELGALCPLWRPLFYNYQTSRILHIGGLSGAFSALPGTKLGSIVIDAALKRVGVEPGSNGIVFLFVNTDFNHARIMEAKKKIKSTLQYHVDETNIRLMSIPDGLEPHDSQTSDFPKLLRALENSMTLPLDKLIEEINEKEEKKVTCLIVDLSVHFLLDADKRYDIQELLCIRG
eukprot:Gb_17587 [translate_table: standard]